MQHSRSGNFYTFVISNNQSLIAEVLKTVDSLREKFDLFSPLGSDLQKDSDLGRSKVTLSQSFKIISKRERSDAWSRNRDDLKILVLIIFKRTLITL